MKKILCALVALVGVCFGGVLDEELFLPQITFIEQIPETADGPIKVIEGEKYKADGSYEEYKTGSTIELYLAILKPTADGTYELCSEECNGILVFLDFRTSPGVELVPESEDFIDPEFMNGFAKIKVRSSKDYRWNADPFLNNPATLAVAIRDDIRALYNPIFFSEDGIEGFKKAPAARNLGARNFEVMDLQGRVVRQGFTTEAEPVVRNVAPGSYIVKVGNTAHRVIIR